jgi:hypothetical protein
VCSIGFPCRAASAAFFLDPAHLAVRAQYFEPEVSRVATLAEAARLPPRDFDGVVSSQITRSWIDYCSFLNKSWEMSGTRRSLCFVEPAIAIQSATRTQTSWM